MVKALGGYFDVCDVLVSADKDDIPICKLERICDVWMLRYENNNRYFIKIYKHDTDAFEKFLHYNVSNKRIATNVYYPPRRWLGGRNATSRYTIAALDYYPDHIAKRMWIYTDDDGIIHHRRCKKFQGFSQEVHDVKMNTALFLMKAGLMCVHCNPGKMLPLYILYKPVKTAARYMKAVYSICKSSSDSESL